ncbi:MAG: right-handed parallel beta-helix repeat-containing protein, partial [Myxococcota bacterium]|nr:right-handed parallel beta-helix repeat-containing protein [Myxococcota bacterium]
MASWRVSGLTVTGAPSNGLYAVSGTVTLNGVTSRENEQTGLRVEYGTLEATDCLVQGNHYIGVSVGLSTATLSGVQVLDTQPDGTGLGGNGIVVFEDSSLEATDCLVQGNHDYGVFVRGSTVTLEGVQVLDTHRRDDHSYTSIGIAVVEQSMLMATDCLVQGNHDFGVSVRGSTVTLQGVKILDTATSSYLDTGRGIQIGEGSTLEASNCLVQGNHDAGVLVTDDSTATFSDVEILDTVRSTVGTMAKGLVAQLSANVQATNLTVQDTDGSGLNVLLNSMLTCAGCTLVDNSFAGAVIQAGGELVIHDSLIEGTISDINTGAGLGVFVYDRGQTQAYPLALTLENSTIRDNEMGAVYIKGAGSYELTGNHLSGGNGLEVNPGLWAHGDAVFVTAGEQVPMTWDEEEQVGLLLEDNTFSDSAGAGVFLDGASATLADNTYEGNTIDLVRQACGQADAPEGLDEEPISTTELCPDYDYLTQDLELHTYLEDTEAEN